MPRLDGACSVNLKEELLTGSGKQTAYSNFGMENVEVDISFKAIELNIRLKKSNIGRQHNQLTPDLPIHQRYPPKPSLLQF